MDPISLTVTSIEGDPERPTALLMQDDEGRAYRVEVPSAGQAADSATGQAEALAGVPQAQLAMGVVPLTPREIQTAIRSGLSAQEVADQYGEDIERIRRFEGPVVLERAHMAQRAGSTMVRRDGSTASLAELVTARLSRRGDDSASLEWDAWRRDDGRWTVRATWLSIGGDIGEDSLASATWTFDHQGRTVVPADAAARGLVEDEATPAPETASGSRTAPGGDPYAPVDDLTALADATAPTVIVERPEPTPRSTWTPVIVDGGRRDAEERQDQATHEGRDRGGPTDDSDAGDRDDAQADGDGATDVAADDDDAAVDDLSGADASQEWIQDWPEDLDATHVADEDQTGEHADDADEGSLGAPGSPRGRQADQVQEPDEDERQPAAPTSSRRRTSVPSWDEILFGSAPSSRPDER